MNRRGAACVNSLSTKDFFALTGCERRKSRQFSDSRFQRPGSPLQSAGIFAAARNSSAPPHSHAISARRWSRRGNVGDFAYGLIG